MALAQYNRMNAQSIFVNEAGGNEALGEPSASMRKDEIARLFLQSENFLREIAACHRGFSPGLQDRRCRRDAAAPPYDALLHRRAPASSDPPVCRP